METRVHLPDMEPPASITEVILALRSKKLEPKHEKKDWGDWITFPDMQTVISIESMRGLASSATVEHAEEDGDEGGEELGGDDEVVGGKSDGGEEVQRGARGP